MDIKQFLIEFGIYGYIKPTTITFILTMAAVYSSGRMLGLAKTRTQKNVVAFITILLAGPTAMLRLIPPKVEDSLLVIGLGILAYTLIGMKLWGRTDKFLDAKIGEDDGSDADLPEKPRKRK
jgi:hypothetical protein